MDDKRFRKELVEKYLPEFFIIKEFLEADNPIYVIDRILDSEYWWDRGEFDDDYNVRDALALIIEDYCRKKRWLEKGRFIWRNEISINLGDDILKVKNLLRALKNDLERVKNRGIAEILEIRTGKGISWISTSVVIDTEIARKYLGRDVEDGESLTIDEAIRVITKLIGEKEKERTRRVSEGLVYVDEQGNERYIWERYLGASTTARCIHLYKDFIDAKRLEKIQKWLEELKEKGVSEKLKIKVIPDGEYCDVYWEGSTLCIKDCCASKYLGRKVRPGETLTIDEVLEIIRKAKVDVEIWRKKRSIFS